MFKSSVSAFFLAIILLVAIACTFETDDIILTEIVRDTSSLQVGFTANQDTIQVFGEAQIQFDYDFEGRELISYIAFLDGEELENAINFSSNGRFVQFDTRPYEDGYYRLNLSFLVRTNSGSLADQAGAEFYTVELSQIIFIDNIPVTPLEIIGTQIVNGALQVKWNKYNGFGFDSYHITGAGLLTDVSDTTAIIRNYAGGKIDIRLSISAKSQFIESITTYTDNLNVNIEETDTEFNITWDPTPYYSDFLYYEYRTIDNTSSSSFVDEQIRNISETSRRLDKRGFPTSYTVSGRILNSFFLEEQTLGDKSYDIAGQGTFLKKAVEINDDVFVAKFQNSSVFSSVIYFDAKTGRETAIVDGVADVSNDGKDIFHFTNGSINKMSNTEFQVLESYPINQNSELGINIRNLMAIGNNRLLIEAVYADNSASLFVMDFNTKTLSRSNTSGLSFFDGFVSDDGKYLYSSNGVPSIGISVFDLEENRFADPERNGSRFSDSYFIASNNRILRFDEPNLYTTDLDGNNRLNLNISSNAHSVYRSIDGGNVIAYDEAQGSDVIIFSTSRSFVPNTIAQYQNTIIYNVIDDFLIGFSNNRMFLRKLE